MKACIQQIFGLIFVFPILICEYMKNAINRVTDENGAGKTRNIEQRTFI